MDPCAFREASHDPPVFAPHEDAALECATWDIHPFLSPDIDWPAPGHLEDQDFLEGPEWLDSVNPFNEAAAIITEDYVSATATPSNNFPSKCEKLGRPQGGHRGTPFLG